MLVTLILPQLILQFVPKGEGFRGGITQSPYGAFQKYRDTIAKRLNADNKALNRLAAVRATSGDKTEWSNAIVGSSEAFRQQAEAVGYDIEKLAAYNKKIEASLHPIQALKAGIKGLLPSLISMGVQFAVFAGLSWAIEQFVNWVDSWANALKYAKEAAENLNKAYEEMNATQKQNTKTVEEYGKTWEKLKDGVDEQGKNVNLSDDEYAQYKNAIEQISNVIPGITGGWNDSNEAIKLNISSVDDLNAKLEETLQKMRDAALTGDTLKDFNNKVGSINLPGESDRVDRARGLMNALYSGSPEKIEEFVQKYASEAKLSDSDNAILQMLEQKGYLKVLKQNPSGYARVYGATGKLPDYTAEAGTEEYKAANELVSLLEAYITSTSDTVTSVLQAWQNEAATWIATQFSSASSALKWKNANGQDLNELFSDDMQTALSNYLKSQGADFFGQFTNYSDMSTKLGKWFGEAADSVNNEVTKAYQKAAEQWQSGKLSYGDYAKARQSYVNSWNDLATKDRSLYNMLVPYLRDYFGGGMDEYSAMRQRAQEKWNFTQEQVDSLTSEQLNYIKSLGADTEKVFTSFAAFLADFAKYQTQVETSYDGLKTKWDKATEAQTTAQEVMTATDANGGVLTQENYNKLIGANKAYGAAVTTIGGVTTIDSDKLNAIMDRETKALIKKNQTGLNQAMKDYDAALSELALAQGKSDEAEITKRKENVEALKKEILNRKLLGQELEYSISAYSKWKKAQSGTESGDTFRELKTAVTDLKDGIKSGRTNTNKYKTSGDVLFGEDSGWREWTTKELNKRLSAAEKLYDKNGELNNREFYNQLLKAGMVDKSGAFLTGNVQKIAKALGYSDTFVAQTLMAAKEYGKNEINFSDDYLQSFIPKTEVENNTDATKNLTTSVDNLKSSVDALNKAALPIMTRVLSDKMKDYQKVGNVDLYHRPIVKPSEMAAAGWNKFEGVPDDTNVTLDSMFYTNADNTFALHVTPILPNGKVLSPKELDDYVVGIMDSADPKAADKAGYNIVLKAETKPDDQSVFDFRNQAGVWDNSLHELQGGYYDIPLKVRAQVERESAQQGIDTLRKDEEANPVTVPVELDTGRAKQFEAELRRLLSTPVEKKVTVKPVVEGSISAPMSGNSSHLNLLKDNADGGSNLGRHYASGTRDAESGQALVGELGPEIVVSRKTGTWRVAQEPQLTKLDKGDIVFNSEETTRILKNKNAPVGSGQSFASGTLKDRAKRDWVLKLGKSSGGRSTSALSSKGSTSSQLNRLLDNGVSVSYTDWTGLTSHIDNKSSDNGGGGGGGGGKKTAATDNGLDAILNKLNGLYDWMERALEVAADATQELIDNVADKIGAVAKNQALDKAIAQVGQELDMNRAGYNKYMETAARVQQETGLSQGIVDQIHTGVIEISDYDDDTKKKIEAYKQWYDKAEAVKDTIDGLIDKQNELAKQKLDNIIEYYDHLNDRLDAVADNSAAVRDYMAAVGKEIKAQDYARDLDAMGKKVSKLREEREAYAKELQSLMAAGIVKYDSNEWHEYTSQLEDMDKAILEVNTGIADMRKEIDQIAITNLKYALDALAQTQTVIEALMGFHDAQGTDNTASNYEDLIRNGFEQIQNLEAQNAELRKQQEGLDKLSERYQELQSEINSNEQSIWQAKTAQEQWNDAIADLKIDALQKERDELEKQNTALQKKLDMEQALEDLAKARQRKKLMFSENRGFYYAADETAIKEAQDRVDELKHQETLDKIDEAIDAIKENKKDDNVYNYSGTEQVKKFAKGGVNVQTGLVQLDGTPSHAEVVFNAEDASKLYEMVHDSFDLRSMVMSGLTSTADQRDITPRNITVQIGDIRLEGVENPDDLAKAIKQNLQSAMLQALYRD